MRHLTLGIVLLLGSVAAQQPQTASLAANQFVPIRVGETAEDGIWTVGERYKASFHDGFRFVPYLGEGYPHNLPLGWRTESVRIGTRDYVTTEPAGRIVRGDRYEFDLGGVIEAYDVTSAATEQTFTIAAAPREIGDLVVTGRVTTPLTAAPLTAAHQALQFVGPAGESIVEYGAATAVDARGRRFPMTTAWDGERMQLRLPAARVAEAAFPLVVDPVILSSSNVVDIGIVDIASHTDSPKVFVVFTRIASASDHDAFTYSYDTGWVNGSVHIADVASTRSCNQIDICSYDHEVTDNWSDATMLVAYEQRYAVVTYMRVVPLGFPSAIPFIETGPAGSHDRNPHLAPGRDGGGACLVYDYVTPSGSEVRAIAFSSYSGPGVGSQFQEKRLSGFGYQSSHEVRPRCYGTDHDSYGVCFAVNDSSQSYIYNTTVTASWFYLPNNWLSFDASWSSSVNTLHQSSAYTFSSLRAASDGEFYRLLTFERAPRLLGQHGIVLAQFDVNSVTYSVTDVLHAGEAYTNGEVAIDWRTKIGMATYVVNQGGVFGTRQVRYERIGNDGTSIGSMFSSTQFTPRSSSVAWHRFNSPHGHHGQFDGVIETASSYAMRGQELRFDNLAFQKWVDPNHPGCGTFGPGSMDPTLAGFENHYLYLNGSSAPALGLVMIGVVAQSLPLDSIGMPGCFLHVDPILSELGVPSFGNRLRASLPLPNDTAIIGLNLLTQWFWSDPGANPAGLLAGDLVRYHVR